MSSSSTNFTAQSMSAVYQLPSPARLERLSRQTAPFAALHVITKLALLSACFSHRSREVSLQLHPHPSEEQLGFDPDTPD